MKESGLEELFAEVYAEHSIVHIISGMAISRALRAHFLAESALVTLLVTMIRKEECVGATILEGFLSAFSVEDVTKDEIEVSNEFAKFSQVLSDGKKTLATKFRTGFHAVRRSDRYWAGLWSDLVIEQTLMKSIKTCGGLTRGRGMSENVRQLWVLSLSDCEVIHQAMTEVSDLTVKSSEQHVEMGMARCSRDYIDCEKFLVWLLQRNPFVYEDKHLHSLSLGLVSDGRDDVNCDRAEEVGIMIQEKLDNMSMLECRIK